MCAFGLGQSFLGHAANLSGSRHWREGCCLLLAPRQRTDLAVQLGTALGIPREHAWPRFVGLTLIWVSLYLCGICSAYFVYHGFLVPACSKVNCQGWETSEGWVYSKKEVHSSNFIPAWISSWEWELALQNKLLTLKQYKCVLWQQLLLWQSLAKALWGD